MIHMRRGALKRGLFFSALILSVTSDIIARPPTKHRVTIEDLETLKRVQFLQLSPDGKQLVYVVQGEKDIWLVATHHGSLPQRVAKGILPEWSPDGKRLAYYSDVSGTLQIWILDIGSGRSEQMTQLEGGINPDPRTAINGWVYDPLLYAWSPDSRKLVFASRVVSERASRDDDQNPTHASPPVPVAIKMKGPLVLTRDTPPDWTLSGVFRSGSDNSPWLNRKSGENANAESAVSVQPLEVNQLFIIDIGIKIIRQLTKDESLYFNPDWSPDGKSIVCASSEGRSLVGYGEGITNIYKLDIATGHKIALTTGPGDKRLPHSSPDGLWVAYSGGAHFGQQGVHVVSAAGGKSYYLTSSLNRSVKEFHWSSDGRSIVICYQDGVSWPIARIAFPIGTIEQLTRDAPAFRWRTTVSLSGSLAWEQSDGSSHGVIAMLPSGGNSPYTLVDLNPQIKDWELGTQEVVRWKNSRDEQLEGILIKPAGYQEGRKYPLIADVYPKAIGNWFMGWGMMGNQAWASMEYAVFFPNARAPNVWMNAFKTESFDQAARGATGWDVTVDDIMSGVDALISRGIVDPGRMGLYGFSNGGGVVEYLVTRTSRFRCAVSVAGALSVDWARQFFLHTADPMVPTIAGVTPWDSPQAYVQLSAVYHLEKVTTPMLLADGDNDGDFLLNTIEMYNGLRWFGRNVTLLRYPDQGHGFTREALRDFWERENTFFDAYLKSPD